MSFFENRWGCDQSSLERLLSKVADAVSSSDWREAKKGDPSELKNSDTFGGERSRFLFQATYQFTLGPQNIDSRPSVLGLIKLVPFGTRNVRRFRAHAKVGQLCQFLSSFTSIRKRALRSGPSVECVNLKTLAGSPFSYDLFVTFSKWGFASKFSEVIIGILVASSDTSTETQ